jgi:hypothetical protein
MSETHKNNRHEKANKNNTLAHSVYKWARPMYVLGRLTFLRNHKDQWILIAYLDYLAKVGIGASLFFAFSRDLS